MPTSASAIRPAIHPSILVKILAPTHWAPAQSLHLAYLLPYFTFHVDGGSAAAKEGRIVFGINHAVRNLNRLARHELDLIEAYYAAIDRVRDIRTRHRLSEICTDHQRHVHIIGVQVTRLGGPRLQQPSVFRFVLKAQVTLAFQAGGDAAVLMALRLWKRLTLLRYEVALRWGRFPPDIHKVLNRNLQDEKRQYLWLLEAEEVHMTKQQNVKPPAPAATHRNPEYYRRDRPDYPTNSKEQATTGNEDFSGRRSVHLSQGSHPSSGPRP